MNPLRQLLTRVQSQLVLVLAVLQALVDVSLALSLLESSAARVQSRMQAVELEAVELEAVELEAVVLQ